MPYDSKRARALQNSFYLLGRHRDAMRQCIVLTARVVREKVPLTLASGAQIWATSWFLYKDSEALFDPPLAYFGYLMVNSLIT